MGSPIALGLSQGDNKVLDSIAKEYVSQEELDRRTKKREECQTNNEGIYDHLTDSCVIEDPAALDLGTDIKNLIDPTLWRNVPVKTDNTKTALQPREDQDVKIPVAAFENGIQVFVGDITHTEYFKFDVDTGKEVRVDGPLEDYDHAKTFYEVGVTIQFNPNRSNWNFNPGMAESYKTYKTMSQPEVPTGNIAEPKEHVFTNVLETLTIKTTEESAEGQEPKPAEETQE